MKTTTAYRKLALAAALSLLAMAAATAEGRPNLATLRDLVARARQGGVAGSLAIPPTAQLARFRQAVRALASATAAELAAELADCGFEAVGLRVGRPVTLLRELPGVRAGGGVYALAGDAATGRGLVLQSPHSFFDLHTWKLGMALFERGLGRAFACNTVHRRQPATGGVTGATADVAHGESNLFHAATLGLADAWPDALFVQFHGFEAGRRRNPALSAASFVLADGLGAGGNHALLERAAAAFEQEFGRPAVAMHGRDTRDLGATGNAQGRALNARAPGRFLHVEISLAMREKLLAEDAELAKLQIALLTLCTD